MSRTIAIGDVHGCADEFEELLNALKLGKKDRVIQLGDLVNHGPHSSRAVELARSYKVESIIGNHELRLLRYREDGNDKRLKDYDWATLEQLSDKNWTYLETMQETIYDKKRDTVFVHGGFLPGIPWEHQDVDTITTIQVIDKEGGAAKRSDAPDAPPWADSWRGQPFVIYGHTPRSRTLNRPGSIGIDTGCVYGGHLTAYIIEDKSFVQVRARKVYAHSKRLPNPV